MAAPVLCYRTIMPKSERKNSIKADYNNKATSTSFVFTVKECVVLSMRTATSLKYNQVKERQTVPLTPPVRAGGSEKRRRMRRGRTVLIPLYRLMTKQERWRRGRRRSPHFLTAPQMISPMITATTANSIIRMHIFFRELRWRGEKSGCLCIK